MSKEKKEKEVRLAPEQFAVYTNNGLDVAKSTEKFTAALLAWDKENQVENAAILQHVNALFDLHPGKTLNTMSIVAYVCNAMGDITNFPAIRERVETVLKLGGFSSQRGKGGGVTRNAPPVAAE